jgi:molecular chaperone Hsp33
VNDHIKRWMTTEGTFRILVAQSTALVAEATARAASSPAVTELFGRLLTGTALMQLAQSPIDRVQCAIDHDGSAGQLLADVWPGPSVRGRVETPCPTSEPILGPACTIHVSRQPCRGGGLFESVVPISGGSIGAALQQFVMESEQVLTFISLVTVLTDEGEVERAGGVFVQALPGMEREHLQAVTGCLEKAGFDDLVRAGDSPFDAAHSLFHTLGLHETGTDPLVYQCRCSKEAAVNAVGMLSKDELEALRRDGGSEVVRCEFCGTVYDVVAADLPDA